MGYGQLGNSLKRVFKQATENPVATGGITYGSAGGLTALNDFFGGDDMLPTLGSSPMVSQFPSDAESVGNFWTEFSFFSWKSSPKGLRVGLDVNTQSSDVKTDFLGIMRLPMPLQLSTSYAGRFTEADDMKVDRDGLGWDATEKLGGIVGGAGVELKAMVNALGNLNNTSKMANASINNNSMGMQYEGGNLRGHTFSWRLSAKNSKETVEIQKVIMTLKGMSLPANNWSGAEEFAAFSKVVEGIKPGDNADGVMQFTKAGDEKFEATAGGRLTIPPTVAIRFLDGDNENPHLFKVKDSFITNVEVNYTSQGSWNPHKDGAPMEVQINVTLKEVKQVTRNDVLRGY
jgi:hypothetical protein